jgi:transposase
VDEWRPSYKLAYHFVTHYDQIVMENLQINGMVRNQHLAKSIWMLDGVTSNNA